MNYHFTRGQFNEDELEKAIISLFVDEGYIHVYGDNIHRKYDEILLEDDLKFFLLKKYKEENLSENELNTIISRIKNTPHYPLYEGNKEIFWLMNEGFDLQRDGVTKLRTHIYYIDFENIENNIFKVVNQFSVQGGRLRRPDMLLFINGIPLGIFEFKSAIKEEATIADAWKQVHNRYVRDISALLKYSIFSVLSDGANTRLGTIFTPYEYYYAWNKVNKEESVSNGISALFSMIKGAFAKDRLIALIRDFIYYPDESKNAELAIITRYPQFFGANNMLRSIKKHLKPQGDGKGGTYFGATGCGKTYTMLFLSRLLVLRERAVFNNPTIIILVDREDLDSQTAELFEVSKRYLRDENVRSIESRDDLEKTLKDIQSGGIYITTIQKFCEDIGTLSTRNNIICISDEAHRTQVNTGSKLVYTKDGVKTTYGFAKYLRDSFPNATYCGFTGTPVDETLAVFGGIVESYTMKESVDDKITVRISYEPRLARVLVSESQAKEIQQYYDECLNEGANPEHIESSKKAMSKMNSVLSNPDRLDKLANDIVIHYEALYSEKPKIAQKAMIVCNSRQTALAVLKRIVKIRPEWGIAKKAEDESKLSKEQLNKLMSLEKIKLVATANKDDPKELYEACGTKDYRSKLDKQFKNVQSNFKIAIVVDMWITGFDVPSLAVMYIDKPLQKHTLIQTISRVNRVFEGKEKGIVVDYIGIKEDMLKAVKKYGDIKESPIDELAISLSVFRNHLSLIDNLLYKFNAKDFFGDVPQKRLICLNSGAEFVQTDKDTETRFMGLSRKLKGAYEICFPSGELSELEIAKAQLYLAIRSIIYKQTKGNAPDTETMNRFVEKMVEQAISCTGVENIINADKAEDMFGEDFEKQLSEIKLPISKFNALMMLLKKAISQYGKTNKVKAIDFEERLKAVVERYNNRDNLVFTSEVVEDFVNGLSDELLRILSDLQNDKKSFESLGITYEEKAFYDILVKVRDTNNFKYADEKCLILAKEIKKLVAEKSKFADWTTRSDIKSQLNMDLTVLLYNNGYPPEWDEEVFEKVMEQAENFKKFDG